MLEHETSLGLHQPTLKCTKLISQKEGNNNVIRSFSVSSVSDTYYLSTFDNSVACFT